MRFVLLILSVAALFLASCQSEDSTETRVRVAINAGPEGDGVRTLVEQYSETKPELDIEVIEQPYTGLRELLLTSLNDQSEFDIVMLDDPWFPELAPHLRTLEDIPESLIADLVPSGYWLSRFPYKTGELRALPFVGNTQLLFYRRDLLSSLGGRAAPPASWPEVASLAGEIASAEGPSAESVYGYAIRGRAGAPLVTDFLPIYWSLGGSLVNDRGTPTASALDPKLYARALTIYKALLDASPPDAANFDWDEMTGAFTSGKAVMQLNWPAAIPLIEDALVAQGLTDAWGVSLPPGGGDGHGTSMIGNWLVAIPKDSPNADAAQSLLVYLLENQALVASAGAPPTRISVFEELGSNPKTAYFSTVLAALTDSTPRPRTPRWSEIETAVSRSVTRFLAGNSTLDQAVDSVSAELNGIFSTAK